MAEVEDVTRSAAGLGKDQAGARFGRLPAREDASRIEVALDAPVRSHSPPGVAERHPMVDADDVAASRGHQLEERRRPCPEMDRGDAVETLEDPPHVRLDE